MGGAGGGAPLFAAGRGARGGGARGPGGLPSPPRAPSRPGGAPRGRLCVGGLAAAALVLGGLAWARGPGAAGGMSVGASKDAASFGEVYRHVDKRHALCVYTRHRDEPELLRSFLDHYRAEGATRFLILDDAEADVPFRTSDPDVKVVRAAGIPNEDEHLSHYLRETAPYLDACEWVVSVDVDEFVSTRRNPCKSVAEELRDSFSEAAAVAVPWVFFSYDPTAALGPGGGDIEDVRDLTMRWNHSRYHPATPDQERFGQKYMDRYDRIEIKPVYRPEAIDRLSLHVALLRASESYFNGVTGERIRFADLEVPGWPKTLPHIHEEEIANALLVTNHYRFTSRDNIEFKCTDRSAGSVGKYQPGYGNQADEGGILSWLKPPSAESDAERSQACILAAEQSNHPEVRDSSMREKYHNRKKGSGCGTVKKPDSTAENHASSLASRLPSLGFKKPEARPRPKRWNQEVAVSAYRKQMDLMQITCAADDECCWVPLAPELEALQPYDPAPFDLASWWPSEESVPQLSVTHLGVGQGTTATHALYDAFCDQGLKTVHWHLQCNFPRDIRKMVQKFIDLQKDLHRKPPDTSAEYVTRAKALFTLAADIGVEAITDNGLATDAVQVMLALAPTANVVLTYRTPSTWARKRVSGHSEYEIICTPPWTHGEDPFQWASCLPHQEERVKEGEPKGTKAARPFTMIEELVEAPDLSKGIGSGLSGSQGLALAFILYNNFIEQIVPKESLSRVCLFD